MKQLRFFILTLLILGVLISCRAPSGNYTLVVEGYGWGPAASKVILPMERQLSTAEGLQFQVEVTRHSECDDLRPEQASGNREVLEAYVSDEKGNLVSEGSYVTLVLETAPDLVLSNPFHYSTNNGCAGNSWVKYQLHILEEGSDQVWTEEKDRILPLVDAFHLDETYEFNSEIQLNYAYFSPAEADDSAPLIIWLHGGGEGGTDTRIPLLANRAANYASAEIQNFFDGAYVLVPQCPGAWMHNSSGQVTWGRENDMYNEALIGLIRKFVKDTPGVDIDRIYIGGCSNGGYMSLKLILMHPDYFAAGFISALAYRSEYLTDEDLRRITNVPLWFLHARDDRTTPPEETVVPVYNRLKELGAENIHFSYFDHVIDVSGRYGGDSLRYPGHWSWIYSHANKAVIDADGKVVESVEDQVSLMEWLALQNAKK